MPLLTVALLLLLLLLLLSLSCLQPGLIQIGTLGGLAPPNPLCLCCPNPLPQDFNLNLEPLACQAPPAANSNSSQAMPSSACSWNMVHGKDW